MAKQPKQPKPSEPSASGDYLIEIENVSASIVALTCPAKSPLMLTPPARGRAVRAVRVPLTAEQFLSMAYDLEGFVDGTHGVTKQLALWVTDRASGRCEQVPFEVGRMVASGGFSADAEASEAQAAQEAEIEAKRKAAVETAKNPLKAGLDALT